MSITHQYLLDSYRARRLGEPGVPAPGAHDWQVVRELGDYWQFRAVLAGRPARGRLWSALSRRRRAGRTLPSGQAPLTPGSRSTKSATAAFTSSAVHSSPAART